MATGSVELLGPEAVTMGFLGYNVADKAQWVNDTNGTALNNTSSTAAGGDCSGDMMVFRFVCYVAICLPVALLGTVGNVVSFIVLCKQKQRLTTTVLLQALSVADTAVLVMLMFLYSLRYLAICSEIMRAYIDVYKYVFCWMYPLSYFFRMTNTWLTVLLTIDRYIAVCRPLQAQRLCTISRAYKNMVALALVALAFTSPRFLEYKLVDEDVNAFGFVATDLSRNRYYAVTYKIVVFFLCMYLVPMTLLVVLNTRLLWALHRAESYRATLQQAAGAQTGGQSRTNNRSVTVIVITVVLVCIVCNTTAMISHVLYSLGLCFDHLTNLEIYRRYLANVNNVLTTINSAINFIIYCLCSRNFRLVFKRTFRCCCCCSRRQSVSRFSLANDSKRSMSGATGLSYFSLSRTSTRQNNVRGRHNSQTFNGYLHMT